MEFLFVSVGWWPFDRRKPPRAVGDVPCVLSEIAAAPGYAVAPRQELVAGRWCHRFEWAGHDRLWLDGERNFVPVAREILHPETKAVLQRIELGDWREVRPGMWFPFSLRNKSEANNKLIVDTALKVVALRLEDEVPDEVFHFTPPPGSLQLSAQARLMRTEPGGTDYLEEVTTWVRRYAPLPPPARRRWDTVENVALAASVSCLLILLWRRNYRAARGIS